MAENRAVVIWLTGLSGAGKSTIVNAVAKILRYRGKCVKVFDGDTVRRRVTSHLGFRPEHIVMNNITIAKLCELDRGRCDIIFVSAISPFARTRTAVRRILKDPFYLVYVKALLSTVIRRDPKGLYKKALKGQIRNFIAIDKRVPFEPPRRADLVIDTEKCSTDRAVMMLKKFAVGRLKNTTGRVKK